MIQNKHQLLAGNDDSLCGLEVYSLETKEIGDISNNDEKKELDRYYEYYKNSIVMISSNIELIKTMHDHSENIQVLYQCAPFFIHNAYMNAWYSIVVKICRLFNIKGKNIEKTSFDHFLSFIEQNRNYLFTTDYYQRWIPVDKETCENDEIEWEKVEREDLDKIINNDRIILNNCQDSIIKVKRIRDKIYAHMDKEMLDKCKQDEYLGDISIDVLDDLAKTAGDIFNSIYYYDKNTTFHFPLMNCDDVLNLSHRCKWYQEHKEDIIRMQLGMHVSFN